ncbi:MAG: MFS transporter [Oceanococcus sp.]
MPILFITVLIDLIGFGIIIPILPFMAPSLGATHFDIALIIAIYSLFGGLVGPFWGRLSDRIGRKPVLLICLGGAAVSYVLLAFSTTLTMLYISRALAGIMAGNFGVGSAMVADISEPQDRAKNMGMLGAAFGLGLVIGPFLGGILAGDDGNYFLVGWVAAGLSASALLAGLLFLPESLTRNVRSEHKAHRDIHGNGGSWLRMLRDNRNTLLTAQFFLASSCHTTVSFIFPLWVGTYLGWGAKEVGMVFGAQGLAMAVLQSSLIGRLVRAFGEIKVLLLGTLMMCAGFAVAAIANGETAILFGFFCTITGGTLCTPVLNTLVANRTPGHLRGRMLGTTSSSGAFGRVLGPLLAGALLSLGNFHIAWLGGAAMAMMMVAWTVSQLKITGAMTPDTPATAGAYSTGETSDGS